MDTSGKLIGAPVEICLISNIRNKSHPQQAVTLEHPSSFEVKERVWKLQGLQCSGAACHARLMTAVGCKSGHFPTVCLQKLEWFRLSFECHIRILVLLVYTSLPLRLVPNTKIALTES
jgi:hypothetical protein